MISGGALIKAEPIKGSQLYKPMCLYGVISNAGLDQDKFFYNQLMMRVTFYADWIRKTMRTK